MKTTKSILLATLVLPLLMAACSREEDPYSTSAAPSTPDRTMESAPPAAGIPPSQPAPSTPSATPSPTPSSPDTTTPGAQPMPPSGTDAPAAVPAPTEEPRK